MILGWQGLNRYRGGPNWEQPDLPGVLGHSGGLKTSGCKTPEKEMGGGSGAQKVHGEGQTFEDDLLVLFWGCDVSRGQ